MGREMSYKDLYSNDGCCTIDKSGMVTPALHSKKRKYYRKCGCCGRRLEQSEMVRSDEFPGGWVCHECFDLEHIDYGIEEW